LPSHDIRERAFRILEKDKSSDRQDRDNDGADGHHAEVEASLAKQCPAKPLVLPERLDHENGFVRVMRSLAARRSSR